jgi:hypothetical protein
MTELDTHVEKMTPADETLAACLRAVLDDPDENDLRRAYADRLAALGLIRDAERILAQLDAPAAVHVVAGVEVGLPLAVAVAFRRGFADAVTVGRDDLTRLGEILESNPISSLRVGGTGALVVISRDGPLWVSRMRVSVFTPPGPGHPGLCVGRRDWDRREDLVAGVGAWAVDVLPQVRWPDAVAKVDPEPVLLRRSV